MKSFAGVNPSPFLRAAWAISQVSSKPICTKWRKQGKILVHPTSQQSSNGFIGGVKFAAMRKIRQVRIFLDSEQVVLMAVKFEAGNYIHMTFSPVGNNGSHLFL